MKRIKLEDMKHKAPFEAPDGYFDGLAHKIQARAVEEQKEKGVFALPLPVKLAIPVLVLVVMAVIFWPFNQQANPTADELLAEVSTEALIDYLYESEVTTDELIDSYGSEEENEDESIWEEGLDSTDLDQLLIDYEITGEYL